MQKFKIVNNTTNIHHISVEDGFKILVIPDMHLRVNSFKNRYSYDIEILEYLKRLTQIVKTEEIDMVVFLGDIFHDEFAGKQSAQKLMIILNMLKEISKTTLIYSLMGNHELHHAVKGCPFFNISKITSERVLNDLQHINYIPFAVTPMLNVVDRVILNNSIQLEMFSFSDVSKKYTTEKVCSTLIGFYHDAIINCSAREYLQKLTRIDVMKYIGGIDLSKNNIVHNVDYALIGDIHCRIGEFVLGKCVCDVIGTIGRTQYSPTEIHELVSLPLFTVTNNTVTKEHINFPLRSVEESFNVSKLTVEKTKRLDLKTFKKALETASNSSVNMNLGLDLSNFEPKVQSYVTTALNSDEELVIESVSKARKLLDLLGKE